MKNKRPEVGITGANGFVGFYLLRYLIDKEYPSRGFVRHASFLRHPESLSSYIMHINYWNISELIDAFNGLDIIVHCAARSLDWGRKKDFILTNVKLVENIVNASAKAGIKRIIHVSTANVEGYGNKILDESANKVPHFKYSKSKWKGEKALKTLCKKHGIEYIILRPSAIYGPEDYKWSYQMIDRINNSWWPLINNGKARFTPLFIENFFNAVELSIHTKNTNRVYNLTDNSVVHWKEFSDNIAHILNVEPEYKNYPFFVAITVAILSKFIHDLFFRKKEPFITPYRVMRSSKDFLYSCKRAIEELGYSPESNIYSNLEKTVKWYKSIGSAK